MVTAWCFDDPATRATPVARWAHESAGFSIGQEFASGDAYAALGQRRGRRRDRSASLAAAGGKYAAKAAAPKRVGHQG